MAFLNETGLATFLSYLKAWVRSAFVSATGDQTVEGIKTFSTPIVGSVTGSANSATYATTPTASDNSTKIATTEFVKSQGYITGSGNTTGSSGSCTGNAATATKLGTSTVGSSVQPIYLNAGTATAVSSALKSCYAVVESEAVTNNIFKIASGSMGSAYNGLNLVILIQNIRGIDAAVWRINLNVGSTAGVYSAGTSVLVDNIGFDPANFIVAYKSNSGGNLDFELYAKIASRYAGYRFTVIQECWRVNQKLGNILTLYNQLTTTGTAAITSGYTALATGKASVNMDISGNAANVTGTIAIDHGGTGATTREDACKNLFQKTMGSSGIAHFLTGTSSFADSGYSSVADVKTILGLKSAAYTESSAYAASGHTHSYLPLSGGTLTGTITSSVSNIIKRSVANNILSLYGGTTISDGARFELYGGTRSANPGSFLLTASIDSSTWTQLLGKPDGTLTWGGQSIQTSSDERLKTPLSKVPDEVLDAWEDVQWGQFQYLSAINCKGESARLHLGLIAQRVKTVFEDRGLDACEYGILCYEEEEDLWMVRYTEALAMEAACQRRRADRLEARIKALEEKLQ